MLQETSSASKARHASNKSLHQESKFKQEARALKLWSSLNQLEADDISNLQRSEKLNRHRLVKYITQNTQYTFISLVSLSRDEREILQKQGLSVRYLMHNRFSVSEQTNFQSLPLKERNLPRRNLARIKFATEYQAQAIQDGFISAICPYSGALLRTTHSFPGPPLLCYRFIGKEVFYLVMGEAWAEKIGLYFPKSEIFISFQELTDESKKRFSKALTLLKTKFIENFEIVNSCIANQLSSRLAVLISCEHFAHHLWNELPAVQSLIDFNLIERVDQFIVAEEPIGRLENIFPEIPIEKICKLQGESPFEKIVQNNLFTLRIGDAFIKKELCQRIYSASLGKCSSELKSTIELARSANTLLIWASLRLGSRTWLSQINGLAQVLNKLTEDFPSLGVVLDGFSLPEDKYTEILVASESLIKQLVSSADQLIALLKPEIKVYSTVGCRMHETILWAYAVDCYIAHHGSIQHKVGWTANKPGVVHTNTSILNIPTSSRPGCWEREDIVQPTYVNKTYITDAKEDVFIHGRISSASINSNYECEWMGVYEAVKKLIPSQDRKFGQTEE